MSGDDTSSCLRVQKKLFPRLFPQEFDDNQNVIREIHDEFRRDGYIYVECNEEVLSCLEELQKVSEIFFNLPVNQKKSFLSKDVLEKRKVKAQKKHAQIPPVNIRPRRNLFDTTDDDDMGFGDPAEVVCFVNCNFRGLRPWPVSGGQSSRLLSSFLNLFSRAFQSSSNSTPMPIIEPQPSLPPQTNNNLNNPKTTKCEDMKANLQILNVNRALGKGYVNNEKLNPREFYDISNNDEFDHNHPDFHRIVNKTYLLFNKYCISFFRLLMFILDVKNEDYLNALMNGESHSKLRLIRYNFIGEEDKETCQRHTDMGLLTLAPALSSGLEMKSFQPPYRYIDVEAASPTKPCLILFAGEALGRLTGGYYQAPIHRVTSNFRRFSFPFFFRSTANLILDVKQLKSEILEELIEKNEIETLLSITANDLEILTQCQYKTKQIPIELGNYKRNLYYQQLFD